MRLADFPDVGRVADVAEVLDVSEWTVRQMISAGRLKALSLGRCVRITRGALEAFIADAEQGGGVA